MSNMFVCVCVRPQLLKKKSPNKRFWWEPLRDMYCEEYKERLPQDWLATAKDKSNVGLAFDNLCADKWTIALVDEVRLYKCILTSTGHEVL